MEKPFHKKTLDEVVKEEGLDKPPKVQPLDSEESVRTVPEPRPGDPDRTIEELEQIPGKTPDTVREIPREHQIPLEEAVERLNEK